MRYHDWDSSWRLPRLEQYTETGGPVGCGRDKTARLVDGVLRHAVHAMCSGVLYVQKSYIFTVHVYLQWAQYGLTCRNSHIFSCNTCWSVCLLYRISSKSYNKCAKCRHNSVYGPQCKVQIQLCLRPAVQSADTTWSTARSAKCRYNLVYGPQCDLHRIGFTKIRSNK